MSYGGGYGGGRSNGGGYGTAGGGNTNGYAFPFRFIIMTWALQSTLWARL